jgi:hypothetical protein
MSRRSTNKTILGAAIVGIFVISGISNCGNPTPAPVVIPPAPVATPAAPTAVSPTPPPAPANEVGDGAPVKIDPDVNLRGPRINVNLPGGWW